MLSIRIGIIGTSLPEEETGAVLLIMKGCSIYRFYIIKSFYVV